MKERVEAAFAEWSEPLRLVLRIESGMIVMTLSEHRELPAVFVAIWELYRKELNEFHKEQAAKKK